MALKLIFMGTPEFSVPILKSLHESKHNILKVYTQPPKKQNRGQKINLTAVHQFCINHNLSVRYPERIDSEEEYKEIKKLKPDVAVVVAIVKLPLNDPPVRGSFVLSEAEIVAKVSAPDPSVCST